MAATMALGVLAVAPARTQAETGWLPEVNAYRASAGLPAVSEDAGQTAGDLAHARYMVQNNVGGHTEDPTRPGFSSAGAAAAQQSNVLTTTRADVSDEEAVSMWMASPFHAIGIVDPGLATTGFGSSHQATPGIQVGAALNVLAGRSGTPRVKGAVMWPGDGASVPLTSYPGNEAPDPLAGCAGYAAPTGLPIILEVGSGPTVVTAATISDGATVLPSCEFDAGNYSNPAAADQANGRASLGARGAVILVPRNPLGAGRRYTLNETVNGVTYGWTFSAGVAGLPGPAARTVDAPGTVRRGAAVPPVAPAPARAAPAAAAPVVASLPASSPVAEVNLRPVAQARGEGEGQPGPAPVGATYAPQRPVRPWGVWLALLLLAVAALAALAAPRRRSRSNA